MAFGTAGSGAPNYGKLYAAEIGNPATFTDSTADTTDGSDQITVDDGTAYEIGDLISGAGIPAGASITAVSTTSRDWGFTTAKTSSALPGLGSLKRRS